MAQQKIGAMHDGIQFFLIYSSFVVIIPFIAAILNYNKFRQSWQRYLTALIVCDFLTELVGHICFFLKINNNFLWPIFIPVEFGLLTTIYKYALYPLPLTRLLPYLIIIFTGCVIIDWIIEHRSGLSPLPHFFEGVVIQLLALLYYYRFLRTGKNSFRAEPLVWLSAGLIIYFASDSIIFLFSNYLQFFSKSFNHDIWFIHAVFNVILYGCYTVVLCLSRQSSI
jgi:hypothetical protein